MPYVDVHGIPTYYEVHGEGPPLLLLHGGYCSLETLRELGAELARGFRVHAPERPGHGRTPDRDGPMTCAGNLRDTVGFMDAVGLGSAHLVGFSDGAIAGLLMSLEHPSRLRSLVAISANLDPGGFVSDPDPASPEVDEADEGPDEASERLRAEYDALSPDGPGHREVVLAKLFAMWESEPHLDPAALAAVAVPVLVMAGDRDVIDHDHTRLIARSIPGAQLAIVPGGSHLAAQERPRLVGVMVSEFLAAVTDPGDAG